MLWPLSRGQMHSSTGLMLNKPCTGVKTAYQCNTIVQNGQHVAWYAHGSGNSSKCMWGACAAKVKAGAESLSCQFISGLSLQARAGRVNCRECAQAPDRGVESRDTVHL